MPENSAPDKHKWDLTEGSTIRISCIVTMTLAAGREGGGVVSTIPTFPASDVGVRLVTFSRVGFSLPV